MLRIYLDWNVFSNLKREEFAKLRQNLINISKDVLIFYTPAHFSDLMKSADSGDPRFERDLDALTDFCGGHLIRWDPAKGMQVNDCQPRDYLPIHQLFLGVISQIAEPGSIDFKTLQTEKEIGDIAIRFQERLFSTTDSQSKALIQHLFPGIGDDPTLADLYRVIPAFIDQSFHDKNWYKNFRTKFQESGMKLEQNAGNWTTEEVIGKIDTFLARQGAGIDFGEMQDQQERLTGIKRSFYDKMISSYHMLDFFGYKADKLPKKTDSMNNIAMDAEHAFYAAHTDVFVVGDKKLGAKAKVLYHYFDVDTLVVDPLDFQERFQDILSSKRSQPVHDQAGLSTLIRKAKLVESTVQQGPPRVGATALKLPQRAFGVFNHLVCLISDNRPGAILQFKYAHKQKSSFLFDAELDRMGQKLATAFSLPKKLKDEILQFLSKHSANKELSWVYDNTLWTLEKEQNGFPILVVGTLSNDIKQLIEAQKE